MSAPTQLAGRRPVETQRGGVVFPVRYLRMELRRHLRNRRNLMFSLVMPVAMYVAFGSAQGYKDTWVGHGTVAGYVMVSMAFYGAVVAATSAGASVSVEMAQGWARTLNLTPLRPWHYVAVKALLGLVAAAVPVVVVTALGAATGARLEGAVWVSAPASAWAGSALFAAFGLLVGLLLPTENVSSSSGWRSPRWLFWATSSCRSTGRCSPSPGSPPCTAWSLSPAIP